MFVGEFYPVHIKPVTVAVRSAHCGKRGPRSAPCHSNGPTSLPGRLPAWAQARRMMSWPSPRETNVQTEGSSINSIIHCCELLQDVCKCKTRVTRTSCKVRSTKKRKNLSLFSHHHNAEPHYCADFFSVLQMPRRQNVSCQGEGRNLW